MANKKSNQKQSKEPKEKSLIPAELKSVFDELDIPEEKSEKILEAVAIKYYSAPLPSPETLKGYAEVLPNGAERIMGWIESQTNHRIELENKILPLQAKESSRGQIFAFVLGLLCLAIIPWMALTGHDTVATVIGGTTVVGLVTAFITGKFKQEKNLSKKQS